MIEIKKGIEPDELKKLREDPEVKSLAPKDAFKMLMNPLKAQIAEQLKKEQGQLCVYCMCRIPREDKDPGIPGTTIEHLIPLDPADGRDVGQALDYKNLFAVCHGNMKTRRKGTRRMGNTEALTCDKHRGNIEFRKIHPLRGETLTSIFYHMDGRIDAGDPDVKYDLTNTLNLNSSYSPIISERKAVLDELIAELGLVDQDMLPEYCTRILDSFMQEDNPKTPYAGVLIWYLQTTIDAIEHQKL